MKNNSYCREIKDGWRYTTRMPEPLRFDAYHLTKTGAQNGPHAMTFDDSDWDTVSVPHDLTANAPLDPLNNNYNGYIRRPNVWFRRAFYVEESLRGKRIVLRFLGVTGVSAYYINGCLMAVNHTAFCGVELDVTDIVRFGREVNVVSIYCDNSRPEGWWYQGTGIFRKVYLTAMSDISVNPMSLRILTVEQKKDWKVDGSFSLIDRRFAPAKLSARVRLLDSDGREAASCEVTPVQGKKCDFQLMVHEPKKWDILQGNLYCCRIELYENGYCIDDCEKRIGFRTFYFDADEGFILNGVRQEIRGMCYHEEEGNLGWNIGREVYEKRIRQLIVMGGNAYRCSHNAPAEELLDLCDQYGILVMNETRRFDTGDIGRKELEYLVCRDRCHPSVVLWSIGNEEPWQGRDQGRRIAKTMRARIYELDGTRPVTMAMHNGLLTDGAACEVDVVGVNYNHENYDSIRAKYPDKPFVASEILNLGDVVYENGNPYNGTDGALQTLKEIAKRPYISGSFGWAGEEYRGEHRNLAFFTDACATTCTGERKDGFYHYRAMWTTEPMVHICGHWNRQDNESCTVTVFSNCEEVALYVNDRLVDTKQVSERYEAVFKLPFEAGELTAAALKKKKKVAYDTKITAGEPVALKLVPEKTELKADGSSTLSLTVKAVDSRGNVTPTGSFLFTAQTPDEVELLCCDNADPYCSTFPERETSQIYRGYGKIVIRSKTITGTVQIGVSCPELMGDSCKIELTAGEYAYLEPVESLYINDWFVTHTWKEEPDIYEYTEDIHYVKWRKYVDACFVEAEEMPFFDRSGYVIYCMEPNMPAVEPNRTPALVFEGITGDAKILVTVRDYNNRVYREYYTEKKEAPWGPVRMELPGVETGERMIIKLVIHCTEPAGGIVSPVRFEV